MSATFRSRRSLVIAGTFVGGMIGFFLAAWLGIHGGVFDVAADRPHSQAVYAFLERVRQRSIAVRAADVEVPADLSDSKRIASGVAQYQEMCSICHLAPGMKRTEISRGLYPRAPELRRGSGLTPGEEFWVVKHGIKMTGMPAWGVTHNDKLLWDIVAFLRKMPEMTAEQYQTLLKSAPKTHDEIMPDMDMGSGHGHAPEAGR